MILKEERKKHRAAAHRRSEATQVQFSSSSSLCVRVGTIVRVRRETDRGQGQNTVRQDSELYWKEEEQFFGTRGRTCSRID